MLGSCSKQNFADAADREIFVLTINSHEQTQ